MATKKAKKQARGKYVCGECGRDVTPMVEALLRAKDTVTAQVRVSRIAIELARGTQRMDIKAGKRTVLVTCVKGHENAFDV
jgi:hypothetical protein